MHKIFLTILILIGLTLPLFVSAQSILEGPLVPCGRTGQEPCTLCDIFVMIRNIINFILEAIFIFAVIFIVVGGIMYLTAGAKPDNAELGKRIITNAIVGVIIALASWAILNTIFVALYPEQRGFPWPWNEVRCTGGGLTPGGEEPPGTVTVYCVCEYRSAYSDDSIRATQISGYEDNSYSCQQLCTSSSSITYCGNAVITGSENMYCANASDSRLNRETACMSTQENWNRIGTSCYATLQDCNSAADIQFHDSCYEDGTLQCQCNSDAPNGVTDPCTSSTQTWTLFKYGNTFLSCQNDVIACSGAGCGYCELGCPAGGEEPPPSGQWCTRADPSGSSVWHLSGINASQKGDASSQLTSFLNCIYTRIPSLVITSISSDILCSNPSCNIAGPDCGHVANSCHFGGTNPSCAGYSYAVDFSTSIQCSVIRTAALACNSSAWVNWETNHTHVSVNNTACGCNEGGTPNPCP